MRFSRIPTNEINLHVAESGPPDGPVVFLLHGFPEFWYGWRNQIAPLSEAGFHVVAPDQRGYNLSDKPTGVASYDLDHLATDILGIADHFGRETFTVAGHDWGASVGWWLAGKHASRVRRLAVLNSPHPAVWLDAMRHDPAQKHKSRYVRFFQIPWLPEFLITLDRSRALGKGFRDSTRPKSFTGEDLEEYGKAWAQPGALTAMINYYRALFKKPPSPPSEYRITCPTLPIWGTRDAYALPALAEASARLCVDVRIVWLDGASHWVQHDQPERVTDVLIEMCSQEHSQKRIWHEPFR